MAETISFLPQRGIPVMGHVGLTPQAVNALGGYMARGRSEAEEARIVADGKAAADAGAFAVVIEGVVEDVAIALTEQLSVLQPLAWYAGKAFHFGFIPLVIVLGMRTEPRPKLVDLLTPM